MKPSEKPEILSLKKQLEDLRARHPTTQGERR